MSTEKTTIQSNHFQQPAAMMRLSNNASSMLPKHNTSHQTHPLQRTDPRWLLAMRAQLAHQCGECTQAQDVMLVEQGLKLGLNPMQSRAILSIVESAMNRGGLDNMAHDAISMVPEVDVNHELSEKARWLTFGVLFLWALAIAGMMQLVN